MTFQSTKNSLLFVFVLVLIFPQLIPAQTEMIYASEDAYIRGGSYAENNYGLENELMVKQGNVADFFRKSYLKFSTDELVMNQIDSVRLRLFVSQLSGYMELSLFETNNDWAENTITWSNAPPEEKLIGFRVVQTDDQWIEFDVTSYVFSKGQSNDQLSFLLYDISAFNEQISFNSREASTNQPVLKIIPGFNQVPEAPNNLTADAIDTNRVDLQWQDQSHNELGFIIERKGELSAIFVPVDTVLFNISQFQDNGLQPGQTYNYRVRAIGLNVHSDYSEIVEVKTDSIPDAPPIAPSDLVATPVSTGQVNLAWRDLATDESFYVVERSDGNAFKIIDTLDADSQEYTDFGLIPSTKYGYRVYAGNKYFDSAPSNVAEITTGSRGICYFLNATTGNDDFPGTRPDAAWQTLEKANKHYFSPGDTLLLVRGQKWVGQLWPKGSGMEGWPILIDTYGTGDRPLIDGNGLQHAGVVQLKNQSYWEIASLEIINDWPAEGVRRGVEIAGEDHGVIRHIYLNDLHVHHIKGTIGNDYEVAKKTGGIFFLVGQNENIPTRFDHIRVENCHIHHCSNQGIVTDNTVLAYPGTDEWMPRRNTDIEIRNNEIHHISKNAMILRMMDGGLVEYNVCYTTATGTTGNTIFTRSSRNVICQFNEGYDNQSPDYDGSLYDADLESPGCIFQYSYSHDNAHGLYWQCTVQQDTGIIVRYNISQNDKGKIIYINYPSSGTSIYNNTIFVGAHRNPLILAESGSQGGTRSYSFRNNLIINESPYAGYQYAASHLIKERIIEHNLFAGNHPLSEPQDPYKSTEDPLLIAPGTAETGMESTFVYKLQKTSPAIDAGIPVPQNGGYDYWGNALYDGDPDIGAHEFSQSFTAVPGTQERLAPPVLEIYPNPITPKTSVQINLDFTGKVEFELLDTSGGYVFKTQAFDVARGLNQFHLETLIGGQKFKTGIYLLRAVLTFRSEGIPQKLSSSRPMYVP